MEERCIHPLCSAQGSLMCPLMLSTSCTQRIGWQPACMGCLDQSRAGMIPVLLASPVLAWLLRLSVCFFLMQCLG